MKMHAASLEPLALLAMQAAGADGYALYQLGPENTSRVCLCTGGAPIPDQSHDAHPVIHFPLRVEGRELGLLAFLFPAPGVAEEKRALLERMLRALEGVWSLSESQQRLAGLAARISNLQAELADIKIADRARSFLESPLPNAVELIVEHVEGVLQARRLEALLTELACDLEQQLAERKVVSQAKSLLRSTYGLSEEQAHAGSG